MVAECIILARRDLLSEAAKLPETASGRSIAITQVMNKWELLMLHRIIHFHTAVQCNLGLTLCTRTIIPDEQRKAFIIEGANSFENTEDKAYIKA